MAQTPEDTAQRPEPHPVAEPSGTPLAVRLGRTVPRVVELGRQYGAYIALTFLCIVFSIVSPSFLTHRNIFDVLRQISVNGILAIGMTFCILTGGIDLSVGSMLAFIGLISATFAIQKPSLVTVLGAAGLPLLLGIVLGAGNGALVAWGRVTPFIVTLGTMTMFRGAAQLYSVGPIYGMSGWYAAIGQGMVGFVPVPVIILFVITLAGAVILNMTRFGRHIYAVGGNEEAARAAGINTQAIKLSVYVISGICVAIAAFILTARVDAAEALAAVGYELNAIAAAVVGGTSLFGGRGTIGGTFAGALIIGVLLNGLNLMNISSFIQQIIIGIIIIAAVWLDNRLRRGT